MPSIPQGGIAGMSTELKTKRQIDTKITPLIMHARDYLANANIHIKRKDPKDNKTREITDTKMRNLLNVAANASSGEEVISYLRYQIGRGEWFWNEGEKLINDLQNIRQKYAQDIAKEVSNSNIEEIWLKLIYLYLGYMNREFKYMKQRDKGKGGKAEDEED